ncbi:MAG TPA: glycosyltransferase family 4 protein [Flavisolibacter sp.]|nr:glycosyltransferase family 4 protein [Flavisolibacter sp.]
MKSSPRALAARWLSPLLIVLYYSRYRKLKKLVSNSLQNPFDVFLFFPAYHMGGAEKIHLEILRSIARYRKLTFIVHKSASSILKKEFEKSSDGFIDFHAVGNHPYFRRRLTKLLAKQFNKLRTPCTIFGCNAAIFYDVADLVNNPLIKTVDLIHAFSPYINGIENRAVKSVYKLEQRITINKRTKEDLAEQYRRHSIPASYLDRVSIIYNPLGLACPQLNKQPAPPYRCLWVARGSKEKRPWLFVDIAKRSRELGLPFSFSMVGDVEGMIQNDASEYVRLFGPIHDSSKLNEVYQSHDILITTSVYEGFPLTITEAVCNGLVNISTNVGGIGEHLHHRITGLLAEDDADEKKVTEGLVNCLQQVVEQPELFTDLYRASRDYFINTFSDEDFRKKYLAVLIHE